MKKIIIILLLINIFSISLHSQSGYVKLYEKYSNQNQITGISMSSIWLKLFLLLSDEESNYIINKSNKFYLLSSEKKDNVLLNDINQMLPASQYKDLMIIKEGDKTVTFKILMDQKFIREIIMLVDDNENTVVMNIAGKFNKQEAMKIVKDIKIDKKK